MEENKKKVSIDKKYVYVLLALLICILVSALYLNYIVRELPLVEINETQTNDTGDNDILDIYDSPIDNGTSTNNTDNVLVDIINETFPELNTTCNNLSELC